MAEQRQWQNHCGVVIDSRDGFDVIECTGCGFRHIVPLPTVAELEQIYRNDYYRVEKPLYLEGTRRDLDWWHLVYSDRYQEFEELLPSNRRQLLDVGSGPGFFLQYGQERGWRVRGIEPSFQATAHARSLGLDIVAGMLDEETAPTLGRFDVVHLNNVMEHLPEPSKMLCLCYDLLEEGGLLCVVVPNDYSPFQQALRKSCGYAPWWVVPPHHLNYFNFESLQGLMKRNGFEICLRETTFPIDLFLLMGDNYVRNEELGRACHVKRMTFEKNLAAAGLNDVKRKLYRALAAEGLGREIVLVGRKKGDAK